MTDVQPLWHGRRQHARALLAALLCTLGACVDDPTPPVVLDGTGEVSGIVFFDRDNNGAFTPTAGDSVLADVPVEVRARGTTTVLAAGRSASDGSFRLSVPVGTHDLEVLRSAEVIAANFVWCGARPSVYRREVTFVQAAMRLGCVVRINVAKQQPQGADVTIAGVVTAQPGRFRNDNLYVQDQTGGIQVFGVPAALGLLEGDSIQVTGALGAFNDQLQLVTPRFAPIAARGVPLPEPSALTTAQAAAATTALSTNIGRLVRVQRVTVGAFASGNAAIDDGSGPAQVRLDNNANTSIGTSRFQAGACYNITGILGFFRGTSQLLPRGPQDVTEVPCS
jgi:DNA/RNA endonuclease YhcR with UshA esterase domain